MQPDWENRYIENSTGWDIGHISTPIKEYIDQLSNKELKILIPGCGNAYEAEYLWNNGFKNTFLLDIAPSPLRNFLEKVNDFPKEQLIHADFFEHKGQYDIIIEQTFFCAIEPEMRQAYADQVAKLLKPSGKLVGLLWSVDLNDDHPPYGGSKEEYLTYFEKNFNIRILEDAHNSIPPRAGREHFILLENKKTED